MDKTKKNINLKAEELKIIEAQEILANVVSWINWEAQKQICHLNTLFRQLEQNDCEDDLIQDIEKTKGILDELNLRGLKETKEIDKLNKRADEIEELKRKNHLQSCLKKINKLSQKFN